MSIDIGIGALRAQLDEAGVVVKHGAALRQMPKKWIKKVVKATKENPDALLPKDQQEIWKVLREERIFVAFGPRNEFVGCLVMWGLRARYDGVEGEWAELGTVYIEPRSVNP